MTDPPLKPRGQEWPGSVGASSPRDPPEGPEARTEDHVRRMRWVIEVILAVLGIQAFYGGVQLIRDAFGLPADWLAALPFDSWVVPGILLMALIGVPSFGLLGLHVAGNRWADPLTVGFGCAVMLWIVVQVFFIPFFFLQPLVFVLGLALALLAWTRMRTEAG